MTNSAERRQKKARRRLEKIMDSAIMQEIKGDGSLDNQYARKLMQNGKIVVVWLFQKYEGRSFYATGVISRLNSPSFFTTDTYCAGKSKQQFVG